MGRPNSVSRSKLRRQSVDEFLNRIPMTAVMGFAFAIALAARGVYLLVFRDSPFFSVPIVDSLWHDTWARAWAEGNWSMGGRAFFRAPLYPFWLSLIYRVAGHDLTAVRLVQMVIGASTAAALAGCGWRLGGKKVALWSGVIAALYGPLIFFDGELLIPNLLVGLLSWALFAFLGPPSVPRCLIGSTFLGLAIIARPNALVLVPLSLIFLWIQIRDNKKARMRIVALAAVVSLIPSIVTTAINLKQEKGLVFVASQGGVNFYGGNNPQATGKTVVIPELMDVRNSWADFVEASRRVAEENVGKPLNSREISDFWARRAWTWIGAHPADAFRLTAKKAFFVLNAYEMPNNRDLCYDRPFPLTLLMWELPWFSFPWGIVFPLAVTGAFLGIRKRQTRWKTGLVASWVVFYGLSLIPFFVCARFRMGMVAGVILLAAVALSRGKELLRPAVLVIGISSLVLVNANWFSVGQRDPRQERARRGVVLVDAGRVEDGQAELRAVLEPPQDGTNLPSYLAEFAFKLGETYYKQGNNIEALHYFRQSMELGCTNLGVLITMANHLVEMGQSGEAVRALEKAAEIRPLDGKIWSDLGRGYEINGDIDGAISVYRKSIRLYPEYLQNYVRLGMIYQAREQPDSAIAIWKRGTEHVPDAFALRFNLALAHAREGQSELAWQEINAALRIEPDNTEALSLRTLLENERMGKEGTH